jgi:hypothetical protein
MAEEQHKMRPFRNRRRLLRQWHRPLLQPRLSSRSLSPWRAISAQYGEAWSNSLSSKNRWPRTSRHCRRLSKISERRCLPGLWPRRPPTNRANQRNRPQTHRLRSRRSRLRRHPWRNHARGRPKALNAPACSCRLTTQPGERLYALGALVRRCICKDVATAGHRVSGG